MAWTCIAFAAIFEIAFAHGMKSSNGFTELLPTGHIVVGAMGTAILGYVWFRENLSSLKIAGLTAIVLGVTSLRASDA